MSQARSGDTGAFCKLLAKATRILLVVVASVLARLDRLPPVATLAVPGDRLGETLLESTAWLPLEGVDPGGVEAVAAIVPRAVGDVPHETRIRAAELENQVCHLEILALLSANVVNAPRLALAQDEVYGGALVLDVHPRALLATVPVDRNRLALEGVRDEERDHFLRVLERPVDVRPPGDHGLDTEGAHVGEHLQVAAGFRGRVRARRAQWIVLLGGGPGGNIPVHLVRRDLNEARARAACPFEEHVRPDDVRANEVAGRENRTVDVRLGGEVDDCVAAFPRSGYGHGVGDVTMDEHVVDPLEIRKVARIGELVENDHLVPAGDESLHEVASDEAATACHEDAHRLTLKADARRRLAGPHASAEGGALPDARWPGPSTRGGTPGGRALRSRSERRGSGSPPRRRWLRRTRPTCSRLRRRRATSRTEHRAAHALPGLDGRHTWDSRVGRRRRAPRPAGRRARASSGRSCDLSSRRATSCERSSPRPPLARPRASSGRRPKEGLARRTRHMARASSRRTHSPSRNTPRAPPARRRCAFPRRSRGMRRRFLPPRRRHPSKPPREEPALAEDPGARSRHMDARLLRGKPLAGRFRAAPEPRL